MCGIAGWCNGPTGTDVLGDMVAALHHRGPESSGSYEDGIASLGHARLSIVDLEGGQQPLTNETGALWLVANGEIFNHADLRARLRALGHRFRTGSDCEVVVHLYEEYGVEGFSALNGQYAFALWDAPRRRLILCRDRVGICPLYYAFVGDTLYFASEVKSLLAVPGLQAQLDVPALGAVWTYWALPPGRTLFRGVHELLPAHYAVVAAGKRTLDVQRYWALDFTARPWSLVDANDAFSATLHDAVRLRLQADVPVGAYLSGGLDSSVIASLAKDYARDLHTFSIAFDHPDFDERAYQQIVADHLGTRHHILHADRETLAAAVQAMVYHAEVPQLRAGPVSMMLLASSVREHQFKVVVTGEGSDEFLLGYDLFRETAVRRFMARDTASPMRKLLTRHLYTYLPNRDKLQRGLELTFQQRLDRANEWSFSHELRWSKVASLQRYFLPDVAEQFASPEQLLDDLHTLLPPGFDSWDWAAKAQTIEVMTFMSSYLLSSQGDRMAMAHSVEGRFPFLDHRLIELVNSFPRAFKLRTLTQDKHILRELAASRLPAEIATRPKVPYRVPIQEIVRAEASHYVDELLSPRVIREVGLFQPEAARALLARVRAGAKVSEPDEMALFGMLTTQIWHRTFMHTVEAATPAVPAPVAVSA